MSVISVFLSVAQMKKATADKTFQVSKTNISKTPNAKIELSSKVLANRFTRAKASNKGFRFSASAYKLVEGDGLEMTEGGKLTFKKVLKAIKPYAKMAGKKVVNVAGDWLDGNTPLTDKQIGGLKNSANQAIDGDTKGALKTLRKTGDEAIKDQINKIDANVDESEATDGQGIGKQRKGKFVKGSPEAKEFMRMLREKRKAKSGTGLVKDIKRGVSHVAREVVKQTKKPVLTAIKAGLTAGLVAGSTQAGLTPVAGLMAANYLNKRVDKQWGGKGIQPAGQGPYTLLQNIKPELFVNKGGLPTHGGSFRAAGGGSFLAVGSKGGAVPAERKGGSFMIS